MTVKFPCKICEKPVVKNCHVIQCDSCNFRIQIKCNKINPQTHKHLQTSNAKWYCIKYFANIIPFSELSISSYFKLIKAKKSNSRRSQNPILVNTV